MFMKKVILSYLIILLLANVSFGQSNKWIEFDIAFRYYIVNPTHENSVKAYELLPDIIKNKDYPSEKIAESIWNTELRLAEMIVNENRDALRIGFKLFRISSGEYAEGLEFTIGKLIVKNPLLFLQELKNHRQFVFHFGGLICNYGPDIVDEADEQLIETEKRINSLKQIDNIEINKLRDECLVELENYKSLLIRTKK